jgi:hypothetical protein
MRSRHTDSGRLGFLAGRGAQKIAFGALRAFPRDGSCKCGLVRFADAL